MGYGNYSHAAHDALTRERANLPQQQVFRQSACHGLMNPKGVRVRESRDSAEHPNSVPIAFALDVSGSMGQIPVMLARTELPKFMKLLEDCGVADPQLLFLAVGDATSDRAPLQVGQFETTAELMDRWLTYSFLEGGGGAWGQESYELALYFLAEHTDTDAWTKRKRRGYVFMTGDEHPYPAVSRIQVESVIGDALDEDIPTEAVVAALQETYEPFFLIPDPARAAKVERLWRDLLGDRVVIMEGAHDTCQVAACLVGLTEGALRDVDHAAEVLGRAGLPGSQVGTVVRAITPYAATLGKDAAPAPRTGIAGAAANLWKRLSHR